MSQPPEDNLSTLPRVATWEQWERGRAARRALSRKINSGKPLRRPFGRPRKDKILRAMNGGERGLPWREPTSSDSR